MLQAREWEIHSMPKITSDDLEENFHLLRLAPEKYLALAEEFIRAEPDTADGYWSRHQALRRLKREEEALADLDKVLSIEQPLFNSDDYRSREKAWVTHLARGNVLRALGRYQQALDDFNRTQMLDTDGWEGSFTPLFRADCHARLGNEEAALADCVALSDDHWTPGLEGAPAGNKPQVVAEVRRLAAEARRHRST
jgi:tetratricopeptide (TPR) repeat protein